MHWNEKQYGDVKRIWDKDMKENKNKCNCQHCRDKSSLIGDMIITKEGPNTEENRDKTHITILQNNINELKRLIQELRIESNKLLEENRSLKNKSDVLNCVENCNCKICEIVKILFNLDEKIKEKAESIYKSYERDLKKEIREQLPEVINDLIKKGKLNVATPMNVFRPAGGLSK